MDMFLFETKNCGGPRRQKLVCKYILDQFFTQLPPQNEKVTSFFCSPNLRDQRFDEMNFLKDFMQTTVFAASCISSDRYGFHLLIVALWIFGPEPMFTFFGNFAMSRMTHSIFRIEWTLRLTSAKNWHWKQNLAPKCRFQRQNKHIPSAKKHIFHCFQRQDNTT